MVDMHECNDYDFQQDDTRLAVYHDGWYVCTTDRREIAAFKRNFPDAHILSHEVNEYLQAWYLHLCLSCRLRKERTE